MKVVSEHSQSQPRLHTADKVIVLVLLLFIPAPPNVLVEKPAAEIVPFSPTPGSGRGLEDAAKENPQLQPLQEKSLGGLLLWSRPQPFLNRPRCTQRGLCGHLLLPELVTGYL